jgi:hypothetical protein
MLRRWHRTLMPLLALYTAAFNVLLWLSRLAFAPTFAGWSSAVRWGFVLLAPIALFAATLRAWPSRRTPLAAVTGVSLAVLGLLA